MFRKILFGYPGFFCIAFFILSQINPDILAQKKDGFTNWPEPVFEHFTLADGLPENSVRCILQDHLGYMWFGTHYGLVKYDGYSMKVYQPDPNDSLSISQPWIGVIYEDRSGTLWIGTEGEGLNRFDRATETFTRYKVNPDDSTRRYSIKFIYEVDSENLLVGNGNKLIILNPQDRSFRDIYTQDSIISRGVRALIKDRLTGKIFVSVKNKIMIYDPGQKVLVKDNKIGPGLELGRINTFYQAGDGTIWIGHLKGLAKFNSLKNTIEYYRPNKSARKINENNIFSLTEDKNGFIWCTYGLFDWDIETTTGLICFDPGQEQFKRYNHDAKNNGSISGPWLLSLYKDNSGTIWAGTWLDGLNKWNSSKNKFKRFNYDSNGKRFNTVLDILEDKEGIIWLGTENGLYSFNRHSNEFHKYMYDTKSEFHPLWYLKNNLVDCISIDKTGIIWFTTSTRGLVRFNRANGSFHFYSNNPKDPLSISTNFAFKILPDSNDVLWIGTRGGGLNRFDKKTGKFTRFKRDHDNPKSLNESQICYIYNDRRGNLWIGAGGGGLYLFNRTDQSFKPFSFDEENEHGGIYTMYEDHKENFWLGTFLHGLYLFDRDTGTPVYNITVRDGLSHNTVNSILEDDSGNLWIGTAYGLSKFDPETRRIRNYYTSDKFLENRYFWSSACKTSNGNMLFGTYDGFIMFNPDSIKDDPVPPQVVISNVSLFNRPGKKLKFDGFISEMKEIDLSYDENDLRFDYVGLHYGDPSKNRYKYKLQGFDKDWVDAGTQRNATYTNLDAGEYIFKVTACNEDGIWNKEGASIKIIIPPPFWETWWAYTVYILFGIGLFYSLRRYEQNRTNLKHQVELDEVMLKEREETDRMKSRFFANISHEFRTPLTLILGPVEKIISKSEDNEIQKESGLIKRNSSRLLSLVNQLLDLSKIEAGKLKLKASESNIVSFIKGVTMSFESVAERKDIILKIKAEKDDIELYFDREMMIKVMTNLLSNAFKYTQNGGQVTVSINDSDDNTAMIRVRDTGIGISGEELPKLFDRFYQVDSSQTRENEGTGIGLALTKELVELHKGTIKVNSKLGKGSEFIIELPMGKKHLREEEIVEIKEELQQDIVIEDEEFLSTEAGTMEMAESPDEDKDVILIVEDNPDVREFIKDAIGDDFETEEASNGEQGLRKAEKFIPDLIISDIMMPKMDGNELTRRIKNDEKTSHIPVILLTAKSEQESRLEGLETGADDYLIKPFDSKELRIRIKNLIDIRKRLQEKFTGGRMLPRKGEKKLSSIDEKFLSKICEVIELHLSEEGFSIEQFGEEVGMSRVQLHRKLKALTGKSASLYLRSARLAKAREMIEARSGNISEIAYSVGFSSPTYFTACFKEEYGYPPSEIVR